MTASQRQPTNRYPIPSRVPTHPWASFVAGVVGAGLLLPLLLLIPTPVSAQLATVDYLEDFEDDSPPAQPSDDFYDFILGAGTGSFRTSSSIALDTVSYLHDDTGAATGSQVNWDFNAPKQVDFCQGGSLTFAAYFTDFGSTGSHVFDLALSAGSGSAPIALTVDTVGVVDVSFAGTTDTDVATLSLATWYNITLAQECAVAGDETASAFIAELDAGSTIAATYTCTDCVVGEFRIQTTGDEKQFFMDNLALNGVNPPIVPLTAQTTISVTDLRGFDVDPTGTSAIARTNIAATGSSIQTFVARTLTAQTTDDTGCNSLHQVLAAQDHVAYVVCSGPDVPSHVFIKKTGGGAPGFPECGSTTTDECGGEIPVSGFSTEGSSGLHNLGEMDAFPISGARTITESIANGDRAEIAWVFGSQATSGGSVGGKVGADALFLFLDGSSVDVLKDSAEADYTNQAPVQICSWGAPSSTDAFVAAADSGGGTTRVFRVSVAVDERPVLRDAPEVSVSPVFTHSGAFAAANGLGCGNDRLIIQTDDSVSVVGARNNTIFWTRTVENTGISRGVAMDPTGNWVAYHDDGEVFIANATTGTVTGSLTPPASTNRKMELDNNAQYLWIAADDEIAVYETFSVTTVSPVGSAEPPGSVDPSDNLFDTTDVADSLGTTVFGANLLFGALLIGLVSFGVGTGGGAMGEGQGFRFSFPAAGIGALMGFLVAWGLGFFTDGTVFVIVVLSILILGAGVWFRR